MRLLGVVWCPVSGQVVINQVKSWQHFCKEPIYDQFVPRDAEAPVKENIYFYLHCSCKPLEFQPCVFNHHPSSIYFVGVSVISMSMDAWRTASAKDRDG